jgi:hypothetical protein
VEETKIDTSSQPKKSNYDRDLFNIEDDEKQIEEEEEELDISAIEPSKINWFKFIVDKYLKMQDEEGNASALNSADAYVSLLNIVLSPKRDDEI